MLEIVLMNLESAIEMVLTRGRLWWNRKEGSSAKRPTVGKASAQFSCTFYHIAMMSISLDLACIINQGKEESTVSAQNLTS
jgi:hypothetical protein